MSAASPLPATEPLLMMRAVTKHFPGVLALDRVDFSAHAGEVHALVGENGAGKSTLVKVLCGVYRPDEGSIELAGKTVHLHDPGDAQRLGIGIIHQDLQQVPELKVFENLFLGRELKTRIGLLDEGAMRRETNRWLGELGLRIDPTRRVAQLRVAERQMLEIAKALSLQARVLVMDEPTSALSSEEVEHLFAVIRRLRAAGVAIIYISHRFEEIFAISDRVTVLRDGRLVGSELTGKLSRAEIIRMMVGRELTDLYPSERHQPGAPILELDGLSLRGGRRPIEPLSFVVRAGEVVGLAGLLGAGRTEVLETIYGAPDPRRVGGRMTVNGVPVRLRAPASAIRAGISLVTEDRKGQSLVLVRSVRENTSLVGLKSFLRRGFLNLRAEEEAVGGIVRELRVKTPHLNTTAGQLSGGNQQKVVLAKFLLLDRVARPGARVSARLYLLDEPTQGIDVGAKAEVYDLINRLAVGGAGVLIASSDMPELLALCDRILVLCEGRLAGEVSRAEATQERILELATSLQAPLATAPSAA